MSIPVQSSLSLDDIARRIGNDAVQLLLLQAQVAAQAATIADLLAKLDAATTPAEPTTPES